MSYVIKIIAEIVDPTDENYIATNNAVVDMSKRYGCKRSVEYRGAVEIGIFKFETLENVKAFRNDPVHVEAIRKIKKFYKSMSIERNWEMDDGMVFKKTTLPAFQDCYPYILKHADEPKTTNEFLFLICEDMDISEEAQQVKNPSGEPNVRNRLRWEIHYLRHAKLMDKPSRGKYVITERGKKVRKDNGLNINSKTLEQF